MNAGENAPELSEREKLRRIWTIAVVGGDTDLGFGEWCVEQIGGAGI